MGAVYDVEISLRYRTAADVVSATREFIDTYKRADFSGTPITDIASALQCIFTTRGLNVLSQSDTQLFADSSFNASYGWEGVMCDWFEFVATNLQDGSTMDVYPDFGHYVGVVSGGSVSWQDDVKSSTIKGSTELDAELTEALALINEYYEAEDFDSMVDIERTPLDDIDLMYAVSEDGETELQVVADLEHFTLDYLADGGLFYQDQYGSLREMIDYALTNLSWDDLYSTCMQHLS